MKIILASQSPRRRNYLTQMLGEGNFEAVAADIPEPFNEALSPAENAEQLALAKARSVQERYPDDIIIASDTIVTNEGRMLAKPADRTEAEQMLRSLFGHSTGVVTSLAVLAPGVVITDHDTTNVYFKSEGTPGLEEALQGYLDSNDWADKAGAYGIQSGAAVLIEGIKGEYSIIVGLPVVKLSGILSERFGLAVKQIQDTVPVSTV